MNKVSEGPLAHIVHMKHIKLMDNVLNVHNLINIYAFGKVVIIKSIKLHTFTFHIDDYST